MWANLGTATRMSGAARKKRATAIKQRYVRQACNAKAQHFLLPIISATKASRRETRDASIHVQYYEIARSATQ